jgi:hypothetical protein
MAAVSVVILGFLAVKWDIFGFKLSVNFQKTLKLSIPLNSILNTE